MHLLLNSSLQITRKRSGRHLKESSQKFNLGLLIPPHLSGNEKIEGQGTFGYWIPDGSGNSSSRSIDSLSLLLTSFRNPPTIFEIVSFAAPAFTSYLTYIEKISISETYYWQTTKWSVYNNKKKTNIDGEGTHNRWRLRGEIQKINIYKLSEFLFKEHGHFLTTLNLVSYGN